MIKKIPLAIHEDAKLQNPSDFVKHHYYWPQLHHWPRASFYVVTACVSCLAVIFQIENRAFYVILQALATYNDALLFFYPIALLCQTGMNDITNGFIILFISDNHYYVIVGVALMSCAEWRQRVYGFWLLVRCRWEWVSNLYHNDTNNNIYIYISTHSHIHIHMCIFIYVFYPNVCYCTDIFLLPQLFVKS